jgi:hypothetical protein
MPGRWTSVFANTLVAITITDKNVQIGLNTPKTRLPVYHFIPRLVQRRTRKTG